MSAHEQAQHMIELIEKGDISSVLGLAAQLASQKRGGFIARRDFKNATFWSECQNIFSVTSEMFGQLSDELKNLDKK